MKLSIWQQFSSNHSGMFWVVGTFNTYEEAQHAFEELRAMLFTIEKWYRENREQSEALMQTAELSPPEREFAQKYNASWPMRIDWTDFAAYWLEKYPAYQGYDARRATENMIDTAVTIAGQNVIVSNPHQTWMTRQPFLGILEAMGSQALGYDLKFIESPEIEGFTMHTRLTFTAPDLNAAARIETALRDYFNGDLTAPENPPPWHNDEENYQRILGTSKLLKLEHVAIMRRAWERNLSWRASTPALMQRLQNERLALRTTEVSLRREGAQFTVDDLWFIFEACGIPALIAWLEVNDCTGIAYRYVRSLDDSDVS